MKNRLRIVSLLPSSTEIVYELDFGADLVAVSHDCDYPPGVTNKMCLTSMDIDPAKPSSRAAGHWVPEMVTKGWLDKLALPSKPSVRITQGL